MRYTSVILILLLALVACEKEPQAPTPAVQRLELLSDYMTGSFNSASQATQDSAYFDISLEMVRIWPDQPVGYWLYVEQAVTAIKDRPYRQRVYHLEALNDSTFSSNVYSLPEPTRFAGAYVDPERLDLLAPDSLTELQGCAIILSFLADSTFSGKTGDKSCINNWGEAYYATSEVTVYKDQLISWDRGWSAAGEQVWGAEKGGYYFEKIGQ